MGSRLGEVMSLVLGAWRGEAWTGVGECLDGCGSSVSTDVIMDEVERRAIQEQE